MAIKRAFLSVFDKTGIVELATRLQQLGVELVSSGGTARLLQEQGLDAHGDDSSPDRLGWHGSLHYAMKRVTTKRVTTKRVSRRL